MAINFPDPTDSTKYYYEGVTYTWDTNKWTAYGPTAGLLPVLADPSGNVVIKGNLSVNKNIDQNPTTPEPTLDPTTLSPVYPDASGNVVITGDLAVKGDIDDN